MAGVEFRDNSAEVLEGLSEAMLRALERVGMQAEGYAKDLCPVGTPESTGKPGYIGGTLKNSISHKVDDAEQAVYIGTNVEYAPYVELGTVKMDAQPFLKPAAADHRQTYQNIVEDELKNG